MQDTEIKQQFKLSHRQVEILGRVHTWVRMNSEPHRLAFTQLKAQQTVQIPEQIRLGFVLYWTGS
jgi:hypothetical protein